MKKRLVSVVLVAAFAFSMLAGCGSDNSASKDNNKTSADAELLRRWSCHGKPFIRRADEMGEHRRRS